MRKIAFVFILLSFVACKVKEFLKPNINGIWVPEMINWEDGNFNTFYICNDTSIMILSSTQKFLSDSMIFEAEPGFILRHGEIVKIDSSKANIISRILYRFITLPGDTTPSALIDNTILLETKENQVTAFEYESVKYVRSDKYTSQSINTIKNLETKMIPDLKKDYGIK